MSDITGQEPENKWETQKRITGGFPVRPESTGYAEGLFQLMEDLTKKAEDTVWLMDHETVFERCWMIIEQQEGRARLEERFPDYA